MKLLIFDLHQAGDLSHTKITRFLESAQIPASRGNRIGGRYLVFAITSEGAEKLASTDPSPLEITYVKGRVEYVLGSMPSLLHGKSRQTVVQEPLQVRDAQARRPPSRLRDEFPETFDMPEAQHPLRTFNEDQAVAYVTNALEERQEYDAGNAILFLSQSGRLSGQAITAVAEAFLRYGGFVSKIGEKLQPKIARSLGAWLQKNGNAQLAERLVKLPPA